MPRFEIPEGWCVQAFRFTLDPTEERARALARHFGARRKASTWSVGSSSPTACSACSREEVNYLVIALYLIAFALFI